MILMMPPHPWRRTRLDNQIHEKTSRTRMLSNSKRSWREAQTGWLQNDRWGIPRHDYVLKDGRQFRGKSYLGHNLTYVECGYWVMLLPSTQPLAQPFCGCARQGLKAEVVKRFHSFKRSSFDLRQFVLLLMAACRSVFCWRSIRKIWTTC